jgi:hypothetical protein
MGLFTFFSAFGKEKLNQVSQGIAQRIVAWDPETATEAEIEEMISQLDKVTGEAGQALTIYDKEQKEADAIKKNFERYMSAAELLNQQMDDAKTKGDTAKADDLNGSLGKVVADLEKMRPEVDREVREAEEAKAYYEDLKQVAQIAADKVKSARTMLEQAKRDMKRAELQQQQAQAKAERSEHLAGLKTETSSLGVALASMNKQAEEARSKAAASEMKAKLLTPPETKADENIEAALKMVSGEPQKEANFADRLAALKK